MNWKKIFRYIGIGVYVILCIVALAFYPTAIIPLILLAALFATLTWVAWVQKKKAKEREIPADILLDLDKVERRWQRAIENGEQISQQSILWELAKSKQPRSVQRSFEQVQPVAEGEQPVAYRPLPLQSFRREDIPSNAITEPATDFTATSRVEGHNRKRLFRRR